MRRMHEMAHFSCQVRVLRSGHCRFYLLVGFSLTRCILGKIVMSESLVPGDIIDIGELQKFPCDAILLDGDCIVNESMLTGLFIYPNYESI